MPNKIPIFFTTPPEISTKLFDCHPERRLTGARATVTAVEGFLSSQLSSKRLANDRRPATDDRF
jgi:hypothetical protein